MIRDDIALAKELYHRVEASPELQAFTQNLSIVTFRFVPPDLAAGDPATETYLNELNHEILNRLQSGGEVYVSNAVLESTFVLRTCIVNFRTRLSDMDALVEIVVRTGRTADARMRPLALRGKECKKAGRMRRQGKKEGIMTMEERTADTPISTFKFQRMSWMLSLRDLFISPEEIMGELEILPGSRVLDYGCGTGSFTFAAAQRVGPEGKVYALDIHPQALEKVQKETLNRELTNIATIQTSCITQVDPGSIDLVLFYYVLHWLTDPDCVLGELHRVLKEGGILSFRDPYMKEEEILSTVTEKGWFRMSGKGVKTYRFIKAGKEAIGS